MINDVFRKGDTIYLVYDGVEYEVSDATFRVSSGILERVDVRTYYMPNHVFCSDVAMRNLVFLRGSFLVGVFAVSSEEDVDLFRSLWLELDASQKTLINH